MTVEGGWLQWKRGNIVQEVSLSIITCNTWAVDSLSLSQVTRRSMHVQYREIGAIYNMMATRLVGASQRTTILSNLPYPDEFLRPLWS
jgi:hypothetical protein